LVTQVAQFNRGTEVQIPIRFRWFDAALLTAVAFLSFVAIAAMMLAPRSGNAAVAVIYAPWISASETLSRSVEEGGRFVRFGVFDFIAIVEPEHSGYGQRVRSNGAWFVADPVALAACLKPFTKRKV
jgi:hypothetical protein